ncbi:efflux RND transporter periplasmic adaptor subunit [Floridanema aerugineum]|jgi:HlyD family secretion protein|uniref:Efflux RND transporter periplasmic adaptor subunit n=1 Tax=Floridaenema aerugineum BLCC-F46 TaxID=3153654 RepID=A0ABV4X2E4_9CYAN
MQIPFIGKKTDQRIPWVAALIAAGLLSVSAGTYVVVNRVTPKTDTAQVTVPVEAKTITLRITASGTVVPIQTVNLSPKTAGRIAELLVEQGDKVKAGDIIARMDNADIQAQLAQAKAALAKAQAQLAEIRAGNRPEEISQARARLSQTQAQLAEARAGSRPEEIAQARFRLDQAKAQLTATQTGNPQQIAQTQAQVQAAQARLDLANQRLKANQSLATQGAISADRLQEVISEYRSATANLEEARRRLVQIQNGTSPAEIAQRQAAVEEAQEALAMLQRGTRSEVIAQRQAAVRESQKALDLLIAGSRPEDIAQAEAGVKEAQARVQQIQVQLNDTIIRAPFDGIVTQRYATIGAFVTPTTSASTSASATSTSVVAIARGLEILAKIPEVDIGNIKQGQPVEVVADAYPDQVFKGKVRLIAPEAIVDQNVTSFQVRVELVTGLEELKSGMNVDLTFLGKQVSGALMVPTVAIVTENGKTGVLLPGENHKSVFRPVTIGSTIQDQTQVLEGLKEGEQIYIDLPKDRKKIKP